MTKQIAAVCFFACLSTQTYAESEQEITSSTAGGVYTAYESIHQVRDLMKERGFTLHRCGIQKIQKLASEDETPYSQIQCLYSKPGQAPSEISEEAYWHLNIFYDVDSGYYRAGSEFTDNYQSRVYTHAPDYLFDVGPKYYRERARVLDLGMKVEDCNLQRIYYIVQPAEDTYLSHIASCSVYQSEGELFGNINMEINYTPENMGYSEGFVTFNEL
ncbi:hypothetical protein AKG98_2361 [Moritella sp. JT01]|uniref:hypothetical protein n=1 Tax=Moritella sp. JT01 TaxID=756698 RepID=UPI00079B481D|nr:hypothetical protein [Moritella sp. JT01]KXO13788.1 hypothetical protein AKG98_2361 [Moritella sp. JT01]